MSDITQKWVEVLFPFSSNYSSNITASAISKKIQMPQQTANRILNKLVKKNLLKYRIEGKNKLFYLNLKQEKTNLLLNIMESQKTLSFFYKHANIHAIVEELAVLCDSLIVFGSYSSGKFKNDSDLDLVVIGVKNKEEFNKKKKIFPISINPHFVTYSEFAKLIKEKNPLTIEIRLNHILIGDVSKLVRIIKNG